MRHMRLLCAAAFAAALSFGPAAADMPASGQPGQTHVDAQGCVFVLAVTGNSAAWVPGVGRDGRQICGQHVTTVSTHGPSHVVRRHVSHIPPGYRAAFDDGRLNPHRGLGTPVGQAQMERVWTNTVPRRLVDPDSWRSFGYGHYPARH